MINFLAHAAELHGATTTEAEHVLFTPLIYGVVNLLVIIVVLGLMQLTNASLGSKLLAAMALLLIGGIIGYQFVPAIGGLMVALGIAIALGTTLLSIASSPPADETEK